MARYTTRPIFGMLLNSANSVNTRNTVLTLVNVNNKGINPTLNNVKLFLQHFLTLRGGYGITYPNVEQR